MLSTYRIFTSILIFSFLFILFDRNTTFTTFTTFCNINLHARTLYIKSEPFIPKFFKLSRCFGGTLWFVYFILHDIKTVKENFAMLYYALKIVAGNFPMLYCCKDSKSIKRDEKFLRRRFFVCFFGFISSFLKYKNFFELAEKTF